MVTPERLNTDPAPADRSKSAKKLPRPVGPDNA
ncbi:MAG: hypothetical protein K0S14_3777, partial [Thermomicrobiales bacterium]|nr:hypothetical protein [Thermomicrobiales bacterium]